MNVATKKFTKTVKTDIPSHARILSETFFMDFITSILTTIHIAPINPPIAPPTSGKIKTNEGTDAQTKSAINVIIGKSNSYHLIGRVSCIFSFPSVICAPLKKPPPIANCCFSSPLE